MVETRREIHFLLNNDEIRLSEVGPNDTLLDFLRLERGLKGSKEGCAEGDCGACSVLIGRLKTQGLVYEPVTSCIQLMPSLDGAHVVTIEALKRDGALHPVQRAMAEGQGAQCGFCTPGIVMALYAHWLTGGGADQAATETALQGNLCRCTGYAPILRAAAAAAKLGDPADDHLHQDAAAITARLEAMVDGARVETARDGARAVLPADLADLAECLAECVAEHEAPVIVSGGTDAGLWVTKNHKSLSPAVFVGHLRPLRQVTETDAGLEIGAGASYAELEDVIERRWPWLLSYWRRIGGPQVRAMGAVGANIANGSPIGDTPPVLIALGAEITLRSKAGARRLPLEDFFIAYGQQDCRNDEFLETIHAPDPAPNAVIAAYKISKRRDQDISAVSACFQLVHEDGEIRSARLAFGGMAGTPKRATAAEAALVGAQWDEQSVDAAADALAQDFQPLSDWRASAEYRLLVAQNLLRRFYWESVDAPTARLGEHEARPIGGVHP